MLRLGIHGPRQSARPSFGKASSLNPRRRVARHPVLSELSTPCRTDLAETRSRCGALKEKEPKSEGPGGKCGPHLYLLLSDGRERKRDPAC